MTGSGWKNYFYARRKLRSANMYNISLRDCCVAHMNMLSPIGRFYAVSPIIELPKCNFTSHHTQQPATPFKVSQLEVRLRIKYMCMKNRQQHSEWIFIIAASSICLLYVCCCCLEVKINQISARHRWVPAHALKGKLERNLHTLDAASCWIWTKKNLHSAEELRAHQKPITTYKVHKID